MSSPHAPPGSFPVIGLGASAGGIAALKAFFAKVAADSGAAYVVVLHLSPEHESRLAEVLRASTVIPVEQVHKAIPLEPNRIYVISPNTSLRLTEEQLTVTEGLSSEERRAPVDIFFRTLAETKGARAACVVLSGTGPNGSSGLKRVKELGGLAVAQDPAEAEHADMPRNAIRTGLVDLVLPAAEMPERIAGYMRRLPEEPPRVSSDQDAAGATLREIMTQVRIRTGHDFSNYKTPTVLRRIERRQNVHEIEDLQGYAKYLRDHPEESFALLRELLISVTQFFRDGPAFAALERHVIPRIVGGRLGSEQVRAWVVGCATGEEAYSIAMLLAEATAGVPDAPSLQVFATDLDEHAIARAREGVYTDAEVVDVSPERLRQFFARDAEGWRVRRELRERVLFAHHNVLKDPPFSHLDLISCRNVLIYLNRPAQERLIGTFHFALRPGRFLFVGPSESIDGAGDLFIAIDNTARIFESRPVAPRPLPTLAETPRPIAAPARVDRPMDAPVERVSASELHLQLLELFVPPSIVVTEEQQIVHVSEHAGRYLQVSGGEPTRDLLKMVGPELRVELRTAIFRAGRDRTSIEVRDVEIPVEGAMRRINLTVRPVLREGAPPRGYYVVLFEDVGEAPVRPPTTTLPAVQQGNVADATVTRQLEDDLVKTRAQLRSTIDQYETQVEEARASNEELQAVNEELRSAAEELETSKEELQSVNEELTTVNQELKIKIDELGLTNNDFQNLINSTDIGTIFLDRSLRVKLMTARARDVFNLLPMDAGRPLSDITNRLVYHDLPQDIDTVLERLQTIEREVQTQTGGWYLMRVLPYRTTDERIEGVVLTFQDVSGRRAAETRIRESEERLRLLIDSIRDYAILTVSADGIIASWSIGGQLVFGHTEQEIVGKSFDILFTDEDRAAGAPARELAEARRSGSVEDERWHVRKDGTRIYCSGVTARLGEGSEFVKIARDLTAARQAAEALQHAQDELEDRVRIRTVDLQAEVARRKEAEQRVMALVGRLVTAQEDERARIARDIHDHVGQQLTALRLSLERCQAPDEAGRAALADAHQIVREIDDALDFIAWELRPAALDDLGLTTALSRYLQAWSVRHGVRAEFRTGGLDNGRLAPAVETACYRITQEALNNVAKHAHASRVDVILERRDGGVVLVIEDDGVGFDQADPELAARGLGLVGMSERASLVDATLQIESTPAQGTTVFMRIPDAAGAVNA